MTLDIRTVNVTRYVTPLKEGGSLPAVAEADDDFLYVLKFRGSGQGPKALIAELLGGEIARALGLRVPEIVFAQLDPAFGRTEPDPEIQDLLKASVGLNIALHYLSGSITFDPSILSIDPLTASRIVWLDCLITNVDRTSRNTNMLWWNKQLWLIDHGAALYFHHTWTDWRAKSVLPFTLVKDHVLLPWATELSAVDAEFRALLTPGRLASIVSLIPSDWLSPAEAGFPDTDAGIPDYDAQRAAYTEFLTTRVAHSSNFVKEADHARQALV